MSISCRDYGNAVGVCLSEYCGRHDAAHIGGCAVARCALAISVQVPIAAVQLLRRSLFFVMPHSGVGVGCIHCCHIENSFSYSTKARDGPQGAPRALDFAIKSSKTPSQTRTILLHWAPWALFISRPGYSFRWSELPPLLWRRGKCTQYGT